MMMIDPACKTGPAATGGRVWMDHGCRCEEIKGPLAHHFFVCVCESWLCVLNRSLRPRFLGCAYLASPKYGIRH